MVMSTHKKVRIYRMLYLFEFSCTTNIPVVYRQDCENCSRELYKTSDNIEAENKLQLCNACDLYAK
jgi:hypothetical protein